MKQIIKKMCLFLLLIIIIIGIFLFYAFKIEPSVIIVKQLTIKANEQAENQVKIVVFSDTHYKECTTEESVKLLVDKINQENPDLVFFLGDLIDDYQNDPIDSKMIVENLKNIKVTTGKYAIMGNHDYGGGAERTYKQIMSDANFNLLINDISILETLNLNIIGLDDLIFGNPNLEMIEQLENENNIILVHEGDIRDEINNDFYLLFAGHSHGGQIYIKNITEKILPNGSEKYFRGYYEQEKVYVTTGIGTTFINARFLTPPEIVSINFEY